VPADYHEMLQWMYGGAREDEEDRDYYDQMQDGLERGTHRAFGQRKWGAGGFVQGGGARLAARVPSAPHSKKHNRKELKSAWGSGGGASSSSSSSSSAAALEQPSSRDGGSVSLKLSSATQRKAEKAAMKEAQREKRRSWVMPT
jgi:hypothetical protein